jgi:BirA family transcriptional regulator, biotin operon repressor / biotin---[acetyl-CoA-carboxylase] ligase
MTANCILERVAKTKSTNDDLLERWRSGQLIDPVARIAHRQTAGKGRAGRAWLAKPDDSICFSVAYPFKRGPAQLAGLSLLVGLAVIEGIAKACNLDQSQLLQSGLRLKWPNDLLFNNAKLGGILIEGGQTKPTDPSWMIVGIGLNLRNANSIEKNLDEVGAKVSAIEDLLPKESALPDAEYLWLSLLDSLVQHFQNFDVQGFTPYQLAWSTWDAYVNQAVCLSGAGKEAIYGVAKGIGIDGSLLLEQDEKIIPIYAGDVSLRVQS